MRPLFSILAILLASVALASEPKPYLSIDANGQAIVKSGLPAGSLVTYRIIQQIGNDPLLCIAWAENGVGRLSIFTCAFKDFCNPNPEPQPQPNPQPDPPPPIPTPTEPLWGLVIVYESGQLTPAQGKVITSQAIAEYLQANGLKLNTFDQDATNESNAQPDSLKKWRAKAKSLPYFFVIRTDGVVAKEGALSSESDLLSVLKGGK